MIDRGVNQATSVKKSVVHQNTSRNQMKFSLLLISLLTSGALFLRGDTATQEDEIGIPEGIVWYGVLEDGLAEARETGKPIFLISAAPNCVGVSGIW